VVYAQDQADVIAIEERKAIETEARAKAVIQLRLTRSKGAGRDR
jgi:hypothetical protein